MRQRVKKAFVLAAGFGTRMLPLTRVIPKPLLPLGNVPMLDRTLALLQSWGVEDVVVNVHHGMDAIINHLMRRDDDGLRVQVSIEPEILGTGGALTRASWFFDDGKPFWMINADVGADVDAAPVVRAFRPGTTIASAWLIEDRGPRTVDCENGYIANFRSDKPGTEETYTFSGVHLVDPHVLRFLPAQGFASIITAYEKAMKHGWKVAGAAVPNSWWADIGTPDQLLTAHREFAGSSKGSVFTASSSRIEKGAWLKNCVVLDNTVVGPRVNAENMIIGPNLRVKKCSGVMTMRAVDALDHDALALIRRWSGNAEKMVASMLSPRGSSRSFIRLYEANRSAILIRHDPERTENNLYASHTRLLSSLGLSVPEVLAEDRKNCLTLFEDAGPFSVQDQAGAWRDRKLERVYRDVLDDLVVFHENGADAVQRKNIRLMPSFTPKLFAWEHRLFCEQYLAGRMGYGEKVISAVQKELTTVSRSLLKEPRVLLHRDLQSSNLMLKGNRWRFIDYQGMRLGPAAYDLASLLCDPYIKINGDVRDRLRYYYDRQSQADGSNDVFWLAVVQRLAQALGAYARLSKIKGMDHFQSYITPALRNVSVALEHVGPFPALEDVVGECRRNQS